MFVVFSSTSDAFHNAGPETAKLHGTMQSSESVSLKVLYQNTLACK